MEIKVLVISHNCFSTSQSMGKTLTGLFSAFDKENLCQLYLYPSYPNIDMCNSSFRITDVEVLKNLFIRAKCGKVVDKKKINDKQLMHAEHTTPKMINFNMFLMAHRVYPDFAILDGVEGMEGNGPSNGEPVDHKVVLAGLDYVSVDRIGSELMGIPWENIGYLNYCATGGLGQGDRSKIKILGPDPEDHVIKYKLHDNIEWQYKWKDELILQKT